MVVFVCVSTPEEALIAANVWKADVIVAQGEDDVFLWNVSP